MPDARETQLSVPRRINRWDHPIAEILAFFGFEQAAARRRWAQQNAKRPRVCYCGKPGTVKRIYEGPGALYATHGGPEWWYCEEHRNVPLTTPWTGTPGKMRPMVQDGNGVWT